MQSTNLISFKNITKYKPLVTGTYLFSITKFHFSFCLFITILKAYLKVLFSELWFLVLSYYHIIFYDITYHAIPDNLIYIPLNAYDFVERW